MGLFNRKSLPERALDQMGDAMKSADTPAARGGVGAVGGALVLTAVSAALSAVRRKQSS